MIETRCAIHADMTQPLEDHLCELERSPWVLFNETPNAPVSLLGYFDSENEADDAWADLRKIFPSLPAKLEFNTLADRDWKEAYKANLHPWNRGNLHWVPEWRRESYAVPSNAAIVYFDAGLAFGTGDHPTTRLCAMRLLDAIAKLDATKLAALRVTDAGCGSGILALSAAKLGAGNVTGFDRDTEAVRVSIENRSKNAVPANAVRFLHAGIEEGLREAGTADVLLANIISDVLCIYADNLLAAVAPNGGVLALSGILAREVESVRETFVARARAIWGVETIRTDSRVDGEWCDLAIFR